MKTWTWVRALGGVLILILLVWQVGTGPFLHGLRSVDLAALVAALGIGSVVTVCFAWRWRLVAAGLGIRLPLRSAVEAYFKSQFLNATLPGGVAGDVHRAVRHGYDLGDMGFGVRAVVLERVAGQTVQIGLAAIVLSAFPSPVRAYLPVIGAIVVAVAAGVGLVARAWSRVVSFPHRTWIGVLLASATAMVCQLVMFVLAARAAGVTAPLTQLLPLTLISLLAMAVPVNLAGWGPREGAAAWVFGAAGLSATEGVATSVTFGVLVLIASLPGAAMLLLGWLGRGVVVGEPALQKEGVHG